MIFIRDWLLPGNCAATTGGPACFPGNVIPADRIDPNARALLNLFPLPNATGPTGANQYNYVFQTEQEWPRNDGHPAAHGQFFITEWYAQDTWRMKQNFTLDAGVRFYYMTPTQSEGDQVSAFEPAEWNLAQAPRLYLPVTTAQGRRALNPLTGDILPRPCTSAGSCRILAA